MQEFLEGVFEGQGFSSANSELEALKGALLKDFNAIAIRRDVLLKRPNLSPKEFSEYLELQKSLRDMNDILRTEGSGEQILIKFVEFLQNRWDRIKNTPFSYYYCPSEAITTFCHSLAKLLKIKLPNEKKTVYQFLIYTLQSVTATNIEDPDLIEYLDDYLLGSFVVDADGVTAIPFKTLRQYFVYYKERTSNHDIENALYNPYKKLLLSDDEKNLLIDSSEETKNLKAACENHNNLPDDSPHA